ncbi:MAG: TAT-variant-translocated molybdopterin oxidoreductase [candidate division Zixibacteria bacterium]|nr:TAT-variant-translocated molybdopterin oxidoreductase [candidate division Zixibacteria bacterium]
MNGNSDKKLRYWVSLEDYSGDPAIEKTRQEEFFSKPESVMEELDKGGAAFSRRDMLKLAGVAAVFAAAGCARKPVEKLIPYVNQPEEIIPGVPVWYASTCGECAAGCGVLVKTREGRPIKMEGNPDHPLNAGKLCATGQASVLNLYDPDRLRQPVKLSRPGGMKQEVTWTQADSDIAQSLKTASGKIALLTGTLHGPARKRLIADFLAAFPSTSVGINPGVRHVTYDAISEEEIRTGQAVSYGEAVLPRYRFDKADVLVLLGGDPLAGSHSPVEFARGFAAGRKVKNGSMSKVISFEPVLSLAGSSADVHYQVKPEDLVKVALGLANELVVIQGKSIFAGNAAVVSALRPYSASAVEKEVGLPEGSLKAAAAELWKARSKSLVYAGGMAANDRSAVSLQMAVNLLNSALENEGATVDGTASPSNQSQSSFADVLDLIADMKAGRVEVLIIVGANPVYSLPISTGFAEALQKVKKVVYLGDRVDETGELCDYVLPLTHPLESWGDAEPQKGVFSLMQPAIGKIFDSRSFEDSLLSFARTAKVGVLGSFSGGFNDYLKSVWQKEIYSRYNLAGSFEDFWKNALRRGVFSVRNLDDAATPRRFKIEALAQISRPPKVDAPYRLTLWASGIQQDGRHQNNAWLLETPDPVSKITWDNFVSVAPKTADGLGLKESDVVKLSASGVEAEIPVHIQPGLHPEVLAVAVGWGRKKAGRYGDGIGTNAFGWGRIERNRLLTSALPVEISKTGKSNRLASVQNHHVMEGRPVVQEATLAEYRQNPKAGHPEHKEELISMWKPHEYKAERWGMAIDLNSCIGCNACVVACQSENNIPIVGKDQVLRGREMHWIRIDRYYSGEPENPEVTHQPMLCQHCSNAPCETVCPTLATTHSADGLNQQIYNRCVGTRYCSNNCPYKVRRFNFYQYAHFYDEPGQSPLELVLNPDVTVRTRGIMEKCTFCVQRIREGRERAKELGKPLVDGGIVTACQQTCPTEAIVFGDLNNPESQVAQMAQEARGYHVLEVLNTRPAITYLTKIRNKEKTEEA